MKQKNVLIPLSKRALLTTLILTGALTLNACKKDTSPKTIDNPIAIVYQNKIPYLINLNGDKLSLGNYDTVEDHFGDYIIVTKNNLQGFINKNGEVVIEPIYDRVYPIKEEKAVVIKDNTYYIINLNNEILYTFENDVISESYFMENFLVCEKDGKYGYLKYNDSDKSFTLLDLIYDEARPYENGYAIVGNYEKVTVVDEETGNEETKVLNNLKYNYLNNKNELFFDEFIYDDLDNLSEGYFKVGTKGVYSAYYSDEENTIDTPCIYYKFIDEDHNFLHYNYSYRKTITQGTSITEQTVVVDDEIELPFASSFHNGIAICGIYDYSKTTETFIKEYQVITINGQMPYVDAIYYATGYRYAFDTKESSSLEPMRAFIPGSFYMSTWENVNDTYIFSVNNTLSASTYKLKQAKFDEDRGYNMFVDLAFEVEILNENNEKEVLPWIKEYSKKYFPKATNYAASKDAAMKPYDMGKFKVSEILDNTLITSVRIFRSNNYGLIGFKEDTSSTNGSTYCTAYYILDPVYDKIIY